MQRMNGGLSLQSTLLIGKTRIKPESVKKQIILVREGTYLSDSV